MSHVGHYWGTGPFLAPLIFLAIFLREASASLTIQYLNSTHGNITSIQLELSVAPVKHCLVRLCHTDEVHIDPSSTSIHICSNPKSDDWSSLDFNTLTFNPFSDEKYYAPPAGSGGTPKYQAQVKCGDGEELIQTLPFTLGEQVHGISTSTMADGSSMTAALDSSSSSSALYPTSASPSPLVSGASTTDSNSSGLASPSTSWASIPNSNSSSKVSVIVGAVLGSLFGLALMILALLFMARRRKKATKFAILRDSGSDFEIEPSPEHKRRSSAWEFPHIPPSSTMPEVGSSNGNGMSRTDIPRLTITIPSVISADSLPPYTKGQGSTSPSDSKTLDHAQYGYDREMDKSRWFGQSAHGHT